MSCQLQAFTSQCSYRQPGPLLEGKRAKGLSLKYIVILTMLLCYINSVFFIGNYDSEVVFVG